MRPAKIKPMTIKECSKNFKVPNKKANKEKEKENLNKTQNILLYKILKKKIYKGNISIDSSINKTIENTLNAKENRKKFIKIMPKKNFEIPHTSVASPAKNYEPWSSPTFFTGKNKNEDDLFVNKIISNYNIKSSKNSKNVINHYRVATPISNYRKNLNVSKEKKKIFAAVYKKKDRDNLFLNESQNNITN